MFHHFHQGRFETGQGSINSKEFKKIVDYLLDKHEILEPTSFSRNIYSKNQTQNTICLTFDDGLKSQFDIALPILKINICMSMSTLIYEILYYMFNA